jgi:hypothetical protein
MNYKKTIKNMILDLEKREDSLTKAEIKEAIIELNYYMMTAIDIHDVYSVREIRDEITNLVEIYLKKADEK